MSSLTGAPRRAWQRLTGRSGSTRTILWSQGVYKESRFWRQYLAERGGEFAGDFAERMDPTLPLQDYLDALIPDTPQRPVRILDVGAGPLTYVGKQSPRFAIEIVAVDPLADAYDALLRKNGVEPLVRTRKCDAERLLDLFAPASFDLVSARNCIDHAYDPYGAIEQMVAVTRPGCYVSLHHHLNEARRQNFVGLHQWNFDDEDGHFILSSKTRRIDVTEALAGVAEVTNKTYDDAWISTRIRRRDSRAILAP